jgi:hypothetical protein
MYRRLPQHHMVNRNGEIVPGRVQGIDQRRTAGSKHPVTTRCGALPCVEASACHLEDECS